MMNIEPIKPPIGSKVAVGYGSRSYTATIVSHGREYCQVRFRLKKGTELTRRAAVFPTGTPGSYQPKGCLFAIYNPNSFGNALLNPVEDLDANLARTKVAFDEALKAYQEARHALSVAEAAFQAARIAIKERDGS